jgi:hypothetical protein
MNKYTNVAEFKAYGREWKPTTGLSVDTLDCRWAVPKPGEASYTHIFRDGDTTFRVVIHILGPRVHTPNTQCPFGIPLCQISFWNKHKNEWYEVFEIPYRRFENDDRHYSHHSGKHGEQAHCLDFYTMFDKDEIRLIQIARQIMGVRK